MHASPSGRHSPADRDRQLIVFALAVIATYLIVAFAPDLVPAGARTGLAQFAHGRVVSIAQPSAGPTASGVPSAAPVESAAPAGPSLPPGSAGPATGSGSPSGGAPGQSTAPAGGAVGAGTGGAPPNPPEATVLMLDGPLAGREVQGLVQGPSGALQLPDYRPGDDVVVEADPMPDGTSTYAVVDRWRMPLFGALVGLLTVLAAAVAGWRGLRAVVSLALTLALTVRLFVPLVIVGWSPVPLAVGFGILVTVLSFALTQGINRATLAAILGTSSGLLVTGVLAAIVTGLARFTPAQGSDQVVYLQQATNGTIDLSGLLLAAVVFGGLGLLNDVAISQAATADELHAVDASLPRLALFRRTMNVGTAHLAATINTLLFAYLGTALPLVVLLVLQASNAGAVVSLESVSVEVARTVVGAVGILAAVPITTAIAAVLVTRDGRAAAGRATRAAPMARAMPAGPGRAEPPYGTPTPEEPARRRPAPGRDGSASRDEPPGEA